MALHTVARRSRGPASRGGATSNRCYNAVSATVYKASDHARHELVINASRARMRRRPSSSWRGSAFYVTVDVEFDFVSEDDDGKHRPDVRRSDGPAQTRPPTSLQSAAYKYVVSACSASRRKQTTQRETHHEVLSEALSDRFKMPPKPAAREGRPIKEFWKGLMPEARKMIGPKRHDALQKLLTAKVA